MIGTLKGHDDKVRVVLNKSDSVSQQQLMRVYGALMWSLGKVFRSPEVCRVYIGSFNAGHPIRSDVNPECKPLFEKEQEVGGWARESLALGTGGGVGVSAHASAFARHALLARRSTETARASTSPASRSQDLLHDLYDIPSRSCDRKVNEFVKRVRAARIHCLILGHLRRQMPYFGQKKAQDKLISNLANEFRHVQREHHLHAGDPSGLSRHGLCKGECRRAALDACRARERWRAGHDSHL